MTSTNAEEKVVMARPGRIELPASMETAWRSATELRTRNDGWW